MLGGIIGDIVGSIYEFNNHKSKDFQLFSNKMEFTDDSVLTVATADWLLSGGNICEYYARYAKQYPCPMGGYGSGFIGWVSKTAEGDYSPYNSCGNGSAMRVGPVGWAFDSTEEIMHYAKLSAECTHNHPEGIKGAQAIALCVFMARAKVTKDVIRSRIGKNFGYNLSLSCDNIRKSYTWGATCQDTVPQAICAFLDSDSFEDAIRNAISIGGDSDTLACITGSIAEPFYGIPYDIYQKGMSYLPKPLKDIVITFESRFGDNILRTRHNVKDKFCLFLNKLRQVVKPIT